MLYSVLEQLMRCFEPYNLQSIESSLGELFHLWRILIRIMFKPLLKIVAYNNRLGHHFSKGPLKPSNIIVVEALP